MAVKYVANDDAHKYVEAHDDFENSKGTLYGFEHGDHYTVYSFGQHWPMFIYCHDAEQWFENDGEYTIQVGDADSWQGGYRRRWGKSTVTPQHHYSARPRGVTTTRLSVADMKDIDQLGFLGAVVINGGLRP